MLNQISSSDVHRITSGQVIIDLQSIVKELIENSIDAGSDLIEINFKEHGLESVEVNDNGTGINGDDYETLCLKHHTSKIQTFEDLDAIKTLGFRGEALSSICAVSNVIIETSTSDILPKTDELIYDSFGKLKTKKELLNKRNTSGSRVIVTELFKNLPVRQKNFVKNIKKEFNKMLHFLYNYILINPQIKFIVNNNVNNQKKNLITTQKSGSILNNFIIIYGTKSTDSLKPISLEINLDFKITGFISNLSIGKGRMTKDKQHIFLNSRPIVHKSLMKLINETYHQFNNLQFPNFILNIIVENEVDINLTPDKTLVNFNQDLEVIRDELIKYWELENVVQNLKIPQSSLRSYVKEPPTGGQSSNDKNKENEVTKVKTEENKLYQLSPKRAKKSKFGCNNSMFKTNNLKRTLNTNDVTIKKRKIIVPEMKANNEESLIEKEITVNKLQFSEMELVGQFNLGFLITKLDNNLFIVDQHASDEKANYESLHHKFKVENQQLITPIKLNLNLIETNKLLQFRDVVERNGFIINEKFELTHLPIYKHHQFNTADLADLINQLPNTTYLPKINSILAMKACRMSIMIGQYLNRLTMTKILNNLSELDKPWNCPHGRPTVRYLNNLNNVKDKVTDYEI